MSDCKNNKQHFHPPGLLETAVTRMSVLGENGLGTQGTHTRASLLGPIQWGDQPNESEGAKKARWNTGLISLTTFQRFETGGKMLAKALRFPL